jgi:hypothetical protein
MPLTGGSLPAIYPLATTSGSVPAADRGHLVRISETGEGRVHSALALVGLLLSAYCKLFFLTPTFCFAYRSLALQHFGLVLRACAFSIPSVPA